MIDFLCVELSQESGIKCDDLVSTMQYYGMLKYWKGKHIVLKRKVSHNVLLYMYVHTCLYTYMYVFA